MSHENRIEQNKGKVISDVIHNMTENVAPKNPYSVKNDGSSYGGFSGEFNCYGAGQFNNRSNSFDIVCQICFIPGHGANKWKNKYNLSFVLQISFSRGGNFNNGFRPNQGRGFGPNAGNLFVTWVFGFQGYMVYSDNGILGTSSAYL